MKTGTKLVCIHEGIWNGTIDGFHWNGPEYKEKVSCAGQCEVHSDSIDIEEYLLNYKRIPEGR